MTPSEIFESKENRAPPASSSSANRTRASRLSSASTSALARRAITNAAHRAAVAAREEEEDDDTVSIEGETTAELLKRPDVRRPLTRRVRIGGEREKVAAKASKNPI